MSIKELIVRYAGYNHWANEQLSTWLAGLDSELLYKPTASSFPGIALTVQHMHQSQQFWLEILNNKGPAIPVDTDVPAFNFSQLLISSQQMLDTIRGYREEELLEEVMSTDMTQSRYEFILHMINHGSYHRGQIVTMCRQLGVVDGIPNMDYEVFLWSLYR